MQASRPLFSKKSPDPTIAKGNATAKGGIVLRSVLKKREHLALFQRLRLSARVRRPALTAKRSSSSTALAFTIDAFFEHVSPITDDSSVFR